MDGSKIRKSTITGSSSRFLIFATVIAAVLFIGNSGATEKNVTFSGGLSAGARFHYSKSSFQLTPGPALALLVTPASPLEFEAKFRAGTMFGYDLTGSLSGRYRFTFGIWKPAVGAQAACSGGFIPHHRSGPVYLVPPSPEWSIGIDLVPLRFRPGATTLSFCECAVGTDVCYPGRVLLLDLTLMRFIVPFTTIGGYH